MAMAESIEIGPGKRTGALGKSIANMQTRSLLVYSCFISAPVEYGEGSAGDGGLHRRWDDGEVGHLDCCHISLIMSHAEMLLKESIAWENQPAHCARDEVTEVVVSLLFKSVKDTAAETTRKHCLGPSSLVSG